MRKGEIACNKQFLIFSQCFLPYMALIFHFKCTLKCHVQICLNLDQCKILSSGNGSNFSRENFRLVQVESTCLTLYHTIPTFNDPEKKAF